MFFLVWSKCPRTVASVFCRYLFTFSIVSFGHVVRQLVRMARMSVDFVGENKQACRYCMSAPRLCVGMTALAVCPACCGGGGNLLLVGWMLACGVCIGMVHNPGGDLFPVMMVSSSAFVIASFSAVKMALHPLSQSWPIDMSVWGLRLGNTWAVVASFGSCGKRKFPVWLLWICEPSGSCTLMVAFVGCLL